MSLFHASLIQALDATGVSIPSATWNFYLTGTSTPATVYSNASLATPLGAVVTANSAGRFVPIYLDDAVTYRAVLKDAAGVTISPYDIDPVASDSAIRADLAASSGSSLVGYINSPAGSVATTVQTALRRELWLDDFGAVGDGVTDDKAVFDLFRDAVATIQAATAGAWVTLNLTYGKTYASRDNGWLLGLKNVIVNGNGAHFVNICTAGQSAWDFDHFPIAIGAQAWVGAETTMMTGKGLPVNTGAHYRINTVSRHSETVTTTTAADAGNFAVGDWVLICSDIAYLGGSPPSMHFFQYAKVLTAVAGTGVITLDGDVTRNDYSATLDNTLLSGTFGSAARIFKVNQLWDCEMVINDLIVDPAANFPGFGGYVVGGRDITLNNCEIPGFTATMCDSFEANNCRFHNTSSYEPVDKITTNASFNNCKFTGASVAGDGSGGLVGFTKCHFSHNVRPWRNATFDRCTFGGSIAAGSAITLHKCNNVRFTNCSAPGGILTTDAAIVMTVDGADITSTATTIVIPRASITEGSTLGQFYEALTVGCRIDEVSDTTGSAYKNGKFCIVTSVTDSGANLVIGVNYSGGTSIANGTIFRAPGLHSYHAQGNLGTGIIISDTNPRSTSGIPNGDLSDIRGNRRRFLIAPSDGAGYDLDSLPANGMPKRVWARVHRAYTGATHATLGLECLGVQPTAASYWRIDLKTVGVREATRSVATAALGVDTWAVLPATYTGRYRLVINVAAGGAAAALAEATELLPILELLVEFEDVAHDVAVAS